MARQFLSGGSESSEPHLALSKHIVEQLTEGLGIDLGDQQYLQNLERLMEVLYGYQFALAHSREDALGKLVGPVAEAIETTKRFVFDVCQRGQTQQGSERVSGFYQKFYRKLSQRSRSLPRPLVATTNYDLFNEMALDRLGIAYLNGFMGSVERSFNPSSFKYTIAQKLDMSSQTWSSLDNLVYLIKLHGSLNWSVSNSGMFPVRERAMSECGQGEAALIYPTPAKQSASFTSPYSDLFREFQSRVVQAQSVLVTIGYGFGDEHVNNIIFQALTIPTFRLVIFAKPETNGIVANTIIKQLQDLSDSRIWIIGTEDAKAPWKAHYFGSFVEDIMPTGPEDPSELAIEKVLQLAMSVKDRPINE